jgi:hypothetical protein
MVLREGDLTHNREGKMKKLIEQQARFIAEQIEASRYDAAEIRSLQARIEREQNANSALDAIANKRLRDLEATETALDAANAQVRRHLATIQELRQINTESANTIRGLKGEITKLRKQNKAQEATK